MSYPARQPSGNMADREEVDVGSAYGRLRVLRRRSTCRYRPSRHELRSGVSSFTEEGFQPVNDDVNSLEVLQQPREDFLRSYDRGQEESSLETSNRPSVDYAQTLHADFDQHVRLPGWDAVRAGRSHRDLPVDRMRQGRPTPRRASKRHRAEEEEDMSRTWDATVSRSRQPSQAETRASGFPGGRLPFGPLPDRRHPQEDSFHSTFDPRQPPEGGTQSRDRSWKARVSAALGMRDRRSLLNVTAGPEVGERRAASQGRRSLNVTVALAGCWSLAVADADGGMSGGLAKMVAASSVNSMVVGARGGMIEDEEEDSLGRVARWAVGLPRLLSDPAGLSIFTEFLKKEFSQENITFWIAVEAYRQLSNEDMRRSKAHEIYSTHLSSQASEPVNVDSLGRLRAEQHLTNPLPEMFDTAQTQIFHLMRTDSYTRFLKSDLYKGHLMREMEGHTLLVPNAASSKAAQQDLKKKGKGKENEDQRRKSLLPWRQNKKAVKESKSKGKEEKKEREMNNNLKKAPGPGIDLSTMRKEVFQPRETEKGDGEPVKFCRVVMPDTSTTVVCTRPGHTVRSVLGKLCDKRGISIAYVDVFLLGSDKPLNLEEDISTLGSKEVVIERRVLFRLDLPNHKSIGVKAKPNRCIRDVFKPILNKYGYHMDQCGVQLAGLSELLDLDIPVSDLDNQRVHVVVNSDRVTALPGRGSAKKGSLEEITNQIFEDLMKGKSELAHTFDELGVVDLEHGRKASKNNDEHRSLGLFGRLRNESRRTRENNKKEKSKGRVTFTLPRSDSKKKKKATKVEEPARAEDPHPASSSSGVRNDLASFMASSCVETVDMATFTAANNPLLLPPPDMFDDVHYMHSRLADIANGATDDDDGEENVEPYFQTTTPHFLTFGTPRSKTAPSAFTSAKKQLLVREDSSPYLSAQPVIIEADSSGSVARREAYREKGDLQTLGETISPHFDDTVHTFRPTRLGPSAASALGSFKVPLASPDHVLGSDDRVSPGRECTDLGAMQRLRPIPARRNFVKDASETTPPKTGSSQMEVSVEVHQCTEAQQGVKQPNPQGNSQDKSSSRISPHSLDRTPPSPHLSTPSPSLLQPSSPHHPSAAPEYTPPPPYLAAVSNSAVGLRAKMSPSPTKSRGTPRPLPSNNGIIHSQTQRLSPPGNSGTQRLLPPNNGETQKHSPPNNSATHRGTHGPSPPNRQSAIPVPAPRGGSGMSSGVLGPRGKVDGEAPLVEQLAAHQSRASPFPFSPQASSPAKWPLVKSPLSHERPPVPRSQSSSSVNQPASATQVEGACSPPDNARHSPGTPADHLTGSVPSARRPVAGPLGPNRSGSLDSVMAAGGVEEGRVSLQDGDFLGGKEVTAKHLIWSNINSNMASHSSSNNVTSRTGAVNGSTPEVAWSSGYRKKTGQANGYVIHPYQGPPVPTRGSQLDSTSFSGTFSPHHFSHPSDLNHPQPRQALAGSGTGDRGGVSQNGAHLFMQASGLLEQTVTFV